MLLAILANSLSPIANAESFYNASGNWQQRSGLLTVALVAMREWII